MFTGLIIFAAVSLAALTRSQEGLATVLNSTNGTQAIGQVISQLPNFLDAITDMTNLTFLAPNDKATEFLLNQVGGPSTANSSNEPLFEKLLYHVINGGYPQFSGHATVPTLLTSNNLTNVTGGQSVGFNYDDGQNQVEFFSGLNKSIEGYGTPTRFSQGWIYTVNGTLDFPPSMSDTVRRGMYWASTFISALSDASLLDQMDSLHDATYFIPYDRGYAAVQDYLSALSDDEVVEVLKSHVAVGRVWHCNDLTQGSQLTTLSGMNITVTEPSPGNYFVNNAWLNDTELIVSSGSLYFIDNVLNPHNPFNPPPSGYGRPRGTTSWPPSNTSASSADGISNGPKALSIDATFNSTAATSSVEATSTTEDCDSSSSSSAMMGSSSSFPSDSTTSNAPDTSSFESATTTTTAPSSSSSSMIPTFPLPASLDSVTSSTDTSQTTAASSSTSPPCWTLTVTVTGNTTTPSTSSKETSASMSISLLTSSTSSPVSQSTLTSTPTSTSTSTSTLTSSSSSSSSSVQTSTTTSSVLASTFTGLANEPFKAGGMGAAAAALALVL